ncbi:beta-propeller domain-containing protein [Pontibacillus sp. HMF3514]|uniref:beta-propeller domain-containing protein n=1 Tax=Pontibacillus sp. HMF3514 TaxID=2692425 RepID=UPI00131FCC33|nr:beta-propeller domain-containing protein [Pontibacillus sp. HMF3514]QHE51424.1 hypothetical protein GS400_04970 [Pontibacillus sp. HMF3514]
MKRLYVGVAAVIVALFTVFALQQTMVSANVNDDAKVVPVHKNWTVTFTKSMKPDSFTDETVRVLNENDEKVEVTYELSQDGKVLTIQSPDEGYTMNQHFKLIISQKVESENGYKLANDFEFDFQTRDELPAVGSKENFMNILAELQKKQELRYQAFSGGDEATLEATNDSAAEQSKSTSSGDDGSKTNTQVKGVDEADVLKSDGENFYYVRNTDITITKAHPAEDSKLLSTIQEKDFNPNEIYIYEDRLVVMGHKREAFYKQKQTTEDGVTKEMVLPYHRGQTAVYVYDISNPAAPQKIREVAVQGSYMTSRLIDENLYFITNEHPPFHIMTRDTKLEDGTQEQEDPRPRYKDSAVSSESMPISYDRMHKLPDSDDTTFVTITSFDVTKDKEKANVKTYLGSGQTVYMSKEHIYMAVRDYPNLKQASTMPREQATTPDTKIYQFGVDGTNVTYDAEAKVPGTLINQFAMDEREGTFRVATTKGHMWDDQNPSENNLYTFDSSLNRLGKLEGLAEGERIYSVRFMQNRAYLVTFKQVDPLFVIDLQNAESPKVLGKLKIPGFSNYLHPIGDNHVVGFGKQTKQLSDGRITTDGVKLSLFDISDVNNPIEKDVELIGGRGTNSELSHNHKALYYHADKNLFGFPIMVNEKIELSEDTTPGMHEFVFEGAYLYSVTPEEGFTFKTRVTHQPDKELHYPEWDHRIARMMSIGDTFYTFSNNRMEAMDLNTEEKISEVQFPEDLYK